MPLHRGGTCVGAGREASSTRKDTGSTMRMSEITCTDFDETTAKGIPFVGRAMHGHHHRNKKPGSHHAKANIPSVVGGGKAEQHSGGNRRGARGIDHLGDYLHEVLKASRHKARHAPSPSPAPAVVPSSSERQRRTWDVVDPRSGGGGDDGDGDGGGGGGGGGGIEKSASAPEVGGGDHSGSRHRPTLQRSGRHGKGHLREALTSILARANSEGSSTFTPVVPSDEGLVRAFSSLLAPAEREEEDGEDRRRRYRDDNARHRHHDRRKQQLDHHPPPRIGYGKVFTGREAVDAILAGGHAASREEALRVAKRLERRYDPYEHVMGAHVFKDDFSLYRFRRGGAKKSETNMRSDADVTDETDTGTSSLHSSDRRRRRPTCARAFATIHGEVNLVSHLISTMTEEEVIGTLRTVEVRDRRHNLRTYEDCFVGRELVSLLVSSGCCKTREEAVLVGHVVGEKYDLFESVGGGKRHDLEDSNFLYRFKENSSRSLEWSPREAVAVAPVNVRKAARRLSNTGMCSCRQLQERDVTLVWTAIFRLVDVRDRVWHWRTYKQCFVGSEVVDLLVMKALCTSRADGVRVIRVINAHLDLFEHVTGQHQFEDDYLFYRFKR